MADLSDGDCITVKVTGQFHGWEAGIASVFIKREGRYPTLEDLEKEANRARAAKKHGHELIRKLLLEETGINPDFRSIFNAFETQLEDPKYTSDYTPYHRWHQNPSWPAKSRDHTSKDNPVDLTRPVQFTTDMAKRRQNTDLRQTNAVSVRSSPPISTQPSFLSTVSQTKQKSTVERPQFQPEEDFSKTHLQSTSIRDMMAPDRGKIKAVAKRSAISTSSAKDVVSKPMAEAATKAPSRSLTRQHAARSSEDLTNTSDTEKPVQSKSSPPPVSTRTMSGQSMPPKRGLKDASTPEKRRIPVRPSFVRQHSNASPLFDKHELPDNMSKSTQPLPSGPQIKGKSLFKEFQEKSSPTLSQPPTLSRQPAATPTTQQTLDKSTPRVSSSQREPCHLFFLAALLTVDSLGKL
jgi:hypothetical protein